LGHRDQGSIFFYEGFLQTVDCDRILPVSHLKGEKFVVAVDDSIGTSEGCLERRLPGICANKDKFGIKQPVWDIGLGRAVGDGGDRSEISNFLAKLS
jgi:hypothetical protein